MATANLPSTADYARPIPYLPDGVRSQLMIVQAENGTGSFTPGQVINFQLPSRSGLFIDPRTIFFRYKISYTSGATNGVVRRYPAYTAFQKFDEFIGSTPVSSVYNYHQVASHWVATNMTVADLYGLQYAFGTGSAGAVPTLAEFDSYSLPTASASNDLFLSAPLVCSAIASCDKLLPTGLMAPIRFSFTVASIADQAVVTANISAITITNMEICFQGIDMGSALEGAIASSVPRLLLKMSAWANQSTNVSSGATGFNTLIFNHRYKSIENAYLHMSSNDATVSVNAWGDSHDLTGTNGGTYQLQVGQNLYPNQPINTVIGGGKASVMQYLRECVGSLVDFSNSMSINRAEFSRLSSTASTATEPAKFIVGFPLSKIQPGQYQVSTLMSGIDASDAPISVFINIGTATTTVFSCALIVNYTEVVEIDMMTRNVIVNQ